MSIIQAVTDNLTVNYNLHSAPLVLADMELCFSFVARLIVAPFCLPDEQIGKTLQKHKAESSSIERFLACDGSDLTNFLVGLREADNVLWC